jgi:hypothetical protein
MMIIGRSSTSNTRPPAMTYDRLKDIVSGPTSTIEDLGWPVEPPDARDVVIVS